jgi:hypothetical protein
MTILNPDDCDDDCGGRDESTELHDPIPQHPQQQQHKNISWKDALQYTCLQRSTLLATPQMVLQTIHQLQQQQLQQLHHPNDTCIQYHIVNIPQEEVEEEEIQDDTPKRTLFQTGTTRSSMRWHPCTNRHTNHTSSNSIHDDCMAWIRQQIVITSSASSSSSSSVTTTSSNKNIATTTSNMLSIANSFIDMLQHATVWQPLLSLLVYLSCFWQSTVDMVYWLWNGMIHWYIQHTDGTSDYHLDHRDMMLLELHRRHVVAVLPPPPPPVSHKIHTPQRTLGNDIQTWTTRTMSPSTSTSTSTILWNEPYICMDLLLECVQYVRQQFILRQQQQQGEDTNDIDTIIPVHSIRQWLQPSLPLTTTAPHDDNHVKHVHSLKTDHDRIGWRTDNSNAIAEFVMHKLSDTQLDWILSVLSYSNVQHSTATAAATTIDTYGNDLFVLQRIDRESYCGGSVYVLLLPNDCTNVTKPKESPISDDRNALSPSIEIRLTLYDLQQSINTIQTNIQKWRTRRNMILQEIHQGKRSKDTKNNNNHSSHQRCITRYKLYGQHIHHGEATILNLLSVQCSIEHTVHVQQPTYYTLQQAQRTLQSLRGSSHLNHTITDTKQQQQQPPPSDVCVDTMNDADDDLELLLGLDEPDTSKNSGSMDDDVDDDVQQLEEELLQLQLDDVLVGSEFDTMLSLPTSIATATSETTILPPSSRTTVVPKSSSSTSPPTVHWSSDDVSCTNSPVFPGTTPVAGVSATTTTSNGITTSVPNLSASTRLTNTGHQQRRLEPTICG